MKKIILAMVVASLSSMAFAAENRVRGLLGMTQSALGIGADYEHRMDSMGVGGYFLYSGEDTDNKAVGIVKNQTMSFGGMLVAHVLDDKNFDVYLAPGFGFVMVKGVSPASDETAFGASLKTGVEYKVNRDWSIGLQHVVMSNWFLDKVQSHFQYTHAAATLSF